MERSRAEERIQQTSSQTENLLSELQEAKLSMERMKNVKKNIFLLRKWFVFGFNFFFHLGFRIQTCHT